MKEDMGMGRGEMSEEGGGEKWKGREGQMRAGVERREGRKSRKTKWARKGENPSGFLLSRTQGPPHRYSQSGDLYSHSGVPRIWSGTCLKSPGTTPLSARVAHSSAGPGVRAGFLVCVCCGEGRGEGAARSVPLALYRSDPAPFAGACKREEGRRTSVFSAAFNLQWGVDLRV